MPDVFDSDALDPNRNPPELGAALRALPLLAPAHSAWPALRAELAARRRRGLLRRWAAPLALAATLLLALIPVLRLRAPVDPRLQGSPASATIAAATPDAQESDAADRIEVERLIAANRSVEAQWHSLRGLAAVVDGDAAMASAQMEDLVGLVDLQLQTRQDPRESAALWQRRLDLLLTLTRVQSQGSLAVSALAQEGGAMQQANYQVD